MRHFHKHVSPGEVFLPGVIVEARFPNGGHSLRAMKLLHLMLAAAGPSFAAKEQINRITLGQIREAAHLTADEAIALLTELKRETVAFPLDHKNPDRMEAAAFLGDDAQLVDGGSGGAAAVITFRFSETLVRLMRGDDRCQSARRLTPHRRPTMTPHSGIQLSERALFS